VVSSVEFDHFAGGNAAGRTVEKIATPAFGQGWNGRRVPGATAQSFPPSNWTYGESSRRPSELSTLRKAAG
jgi:hypothetical protein